MILWYIVLIFPNFLKSFRRNDDTTENQKEKEDPFQCLFLVTSAKNYEIKITYTSQYCVCM